MVWLLLVVLTGFAFLADSAPSPKPNFIVFMADDQDVLLGGLTPMPHTKRLLQEAGTTFQNGFVTTPVCCPSRTATLSGMYAHNLDDQHRGWCGDFASRENNTFALWLQEAGYETGLFGKYYNAYGDFCRKNIHVPKGWTRWFSMCDDNKFFKNTFNDQGKMVSHGDAPEDYMTSVIGNQTISWLRQVTQQNGGSQSPFFAYVALHAPHVPATPAPWYNNTLPNQTAPRTPNWGYLGEDHHWVIRQQPSWTDETRQFSDDLFMRRWRSIISIDDIVGEAVNVVQEAGLLNNTYFFYTSDHGYNLGQFRLPSGKFHVYDHDIKVPYLIRGPTVTANHTSAAVVSNLDIVPTVLHLAGVEPRYELDGKPLNPVLQGNVPESWRDTMLIEYWGLGYVRRGPCRQGVSACPGHDSLEDAPSNTYSAVRVINSDTNMLYAEFRPRNELPVASSTNFTEMYNLAKDPYEMHNIVNETNHEVVDQYKHMLYAVITCKGKNCP
ncbi:N-acetylglucosamine-6-sulfatase-like [Corticium candelabrum]|uniref:N-acetylglucosamine-6-sulfatase-like n=1 Tax=Corticium candelabrum TaxID=121492 RepID=UPI002E26218B|nr:N-acetylglucosamine-6-sulfatase-like [Corticium candelabrum]